MKHDPCDVNINGYNHEILCLWGANIDFQLYWINIVQLCICDIGVFLGY